MSAVKLMHARTSPASLMAKLYFFIILLTTVTHLSCIKDKG